MPEITRWKKLFDTAGTPVSIHWHQLFEEFRKPTPFLGDEHPGWSPAVFDPCERKQSNVRRVTAVVLDYDSGAVTIDEATGLWKKRLGFIHTTRSHTADSHRFRVILPLSRAVSPFEYRAIWQAIAAKAGDIDPATKDPSRFWYCPGVGDHPGAEFVTRNLAGKTIDADSILERPLPQPSATVHHITDAGPARERRARAYIARMPAAISGQAGHTSCWNVARKLAQDFGLDEKATFRLLKTEYNPRCQPPWSDRELEHKARQATERARVSNPISDDQPERQPSPMRRTGTDSGDAQAEAEPLQDTNETEQDWQLALTYDSKQRLTKDPGNAALILSNDPQWAGSLMWDSFADRILWQTALPFIPGLVAPEPDTELADHHAVYVQHWFARFRGVSFSKHAVLDAIIATARSNEQHPLQDYLAGLEWDGCQRLPTWLRDYLGADDIPYTHAVGRWWAISAVARAMRPGCQADHVLVLEGAQGAGKSSAVRTLARNWCLGSLPDLRDPVRAAQALQGNWIVEIGELDAFRGAGGTRVKDFITQTVDKYRAPYERNSAARPRSCVFIGTTNEAEYLQDQTGARRFWPVRCGQIRRDELDRDVDQLWAEAVVKFGAGEEYWPGADLLASIQEQQEQRQEDGDAWDGPIAEWCQGRPSVSTEDVLRYALELPKERWDRAAQTRAGRALRRLGRQPVQVSSGGRRVRVYVSQDEVVR